MDLSQTQIEKEKQEIKNITEEGNLRLNSKLNEKGKRLHYKTTTTPKGRKQRVKVRKQTKLNRRI